MEKSVHPDEFLLVFGGHPVVGLVIKLERSTFETATKTITSVYHLKCMYVDAYTSTGSETVGRDNLLSLGKSISSMTVHVSLICTEAFLFFI